MPKPICILASSPRAGGNSESMAQYFAQGVRSAGGQANILFLRDRHVLPCRACYACHSTYQDNSSNTPTLQRAQAPSSGCILAKQDHVQDIFTHIAAAPLLFITAPIFFYHLPAQLKALIDRGQLLWEQKEKVAQNMTSPKPISKPAFIGLVAARKRGDKLFEGSLLTLRYFLRLFDMHIQDTCLMTGYDAPQDLAHDAKACAHLHTLGVQAQNMLVNTAQKNA